MPLSGGSCSGADAALRVTQAQSEYSSMMRMTDSLASVVETGRRPFVRRAPDRSAPRFRSEFVDGLVAVVLALSLGGITYWLIGRLTMPTEPEDRLDVLKTSLTVVGFIGATLAAVYAYRKQRLTESDAHRSDAIQFATRYGTAAEQLGHGAAAVRVAGVYALARLADDWSEQRQTCIDVLCAYLRMTFTYDLPRADPEYVHGEEQVRDAIQRVLADHMRPRTAEASAERQGWVSNYIDLHGATLKDFDLGGAYVGRYSHFRKTVFLGTTGFAKTVFVGVANFDEVTFDGDAWFDGARFADEARFTNVTFAARTWFNDAVFQGDARFDGALFSGRRVFDRTEFQASVSGLSGRP